ncbi:RiPP maturation radical SAM C-methyltransferase [Thermostilla marina]
MSQVLLVNMPFANLRWPNLGISLLAAATKERGISCEVAYWCFDFAERIGLPTYHWVADHFAFVLGGERLFAKHYFAGRLPDDDAYFREVLAPADPELTRDEFAEFLSLERYVPGFVEWCVDQVPAECRVVGFAATFQQTLPSLCVARELKRRRPEIVIAFGGAACEEEMGVELFRRFPEIDLLFLGEADDTFPETVEALLQGEPVTGGPGVLSRATEGYSVEDCRERVSAATLPMVAENVCRRLAVDQLDRLPYPDFDDYFKRFRNSPFRGDFEPLLAFEMSRGCWWGEKHHCSFCGLNGTSLAYRSKSADRVLEELAHLVSRYGIERGFAADNIFDFRYRKTLLPKLKSAPFRFRFVCEMKTNLTRKQVHELLEGKLGAAQLGIETFSTDVLREIGKGATAIHNLQALKWFSEAGIEVKWNILYGFASENERVYRDLAALIEQIVHLAPPMAVGRVRVDRFSPFFERPVDFGLTDIRPAEAFRFVYPFSEDVLAGLAYYFRGRYASGDDPANASAPLLAAVARWQEVHPISRLAAADQADGSIVITDTRPCAARFQFRLKGVEAEIYRFCDTGRSRRAVLEHIHSLEVPGPVSSLAQSMDGPELENVLRQWKDDALVAEIDGRILSLAVRVPEQSELYQAAHA